MSPVRARLAAFAALLSVGACALAPTPLPAQDRGAPALAQLVDGLGTSARVLVVAAHPDDEDTQLITWLARGQHVETAYLSLTRGDGGQNLIGNELGEALGAIRTEELLAARRLDGGRQYFTRAFDFGFSKNAEETLTQWSRDSILRDVITVVRQFRPHVIVAVFSGTPADGHGHHQVSGQFAREAYDASGDTLRFPRAATAGYGPWTVQKFYRSANFRAQDRATLRMNVGRYDPVLGRSYNEIAADSRSQHKSQAMGSLQLKGVRYDQVIREASRAPGAPADARTEAGLLDGIDTTWTRFAPLMPSPRLRAILDSLPAAFAGARAALDLRNPNGVIPPLARVVRLLQPLCTDHDAPCFLERVPGAAGAAGDRPSDRESRASPDLQQRLAGAASPPVALGSRAHDLARDLAASWAIANARAQRALALAAGVDVEATAARELWAAGESVPVTVRVFNRGSRPVAIEGVSLSSIDSDERVGRRFAATIDPDSVLTDSAAIRLGGITQPWWLETPRAGAMFTPRVFGASETGRRTEVTATVTVRVDGAVAMIEAPVVYRYADAIRGEVRRPVGVAPAITVTLDDAVAYAPANTPLQRAIRVAVRSHASDARDVTVRLQLPAGLVADSAERRVSFPARALAAAPAGPGAAFGIGGGAAPQPMRAVTFQLSGRLPAGRYSIGVVASSNGVDFSSGYSTIEYDHIRPQRLYRPATLRLESVDATLPRGLSIAYIPGVGDNVAPMLEQLGVAVTVLDPATLPRTDLSRFGAVVVGTRAYEASDALVANNARLLDYARAGGTLVVQYGQYEMTQPGIMPYPITLGRPADRVTVEGAPVTILDSAAAILNAPNRIGARDFEGWVQDRSLYMPRTFDAAYTPVVELHDPGEAPNRGGILVARYGQGTYVYTSLAFFRQLPSGVPGAARLFLNLLSTRATLQP
jgi:LmbE family N-acetylglucosaminyl deacetylase